MWSLKYRIFIIPVLYILVLLLLPLCIPLCIPLVIYRRCVSHLCQLFGKPGIGKMLTAASTSHACIGGKGTSIFPLILKGVPDVENIKKQFTEKILNAEDDSGELLYPELQQTVVTWGGYLFWRDIPNFKLPIKMLDVNPVEIDSPAGLTLLQKLYGIEWKLGKEALWEMLIVPGLNGHFSIIINFHHALCDAFAMQKLIDKVSHPSIIPKKKKTVVPPSKQNAVLLLVKTLLKIPLEFASFLEAVIRTYFSEEHATALKDVVVSADRQKAQFTHEAVSFNLADLKKTAAGYNVSLSALFISLIQSSLIKSGSVDGPSCLIYFPTPPRSHPAKLRNVTGMGYLELRNNYDNVAGHQSLKIIEEQLHRIKESTLPFVMTLISTLSGSLPPFLLRKTIDSASAAGTMRTFLLSMFIAWRHTFSFMGYPVIQLGSVGSCHAGANVIGFFAFSSHDLVRVTLVGDSCVVGDEEGKALVNGIKSRFIELKKALNTTENYTCVTLDPDISDEGKH